MSLPRSTVHRLPALAAALLALALAGCVTIDADLTVSGDTVSGTLVTALDEAAAQQLELEPGDVFAATDEQFTNLSGVTAAPYDDGTAIGTEYTFDQVALADLNRLSEQDPDGLQIIRNPQAGTYELAMVMDLAWLAELDEGDLEQELNDPDAPDPAELLERFDATIAVTFPGEVTEHNGELSGSTVTWRPPPGERTELRAVALDPDPPAGAAPAGPGQPDQPGNEAERPGDSATADTSGGPSPALVALLIGLGVVLLAAAGLGITWLVRRRRPAAGPPSEAPPDAAPEEADTEPSKPTAAAPPEAAEPAEPAGREPAEERAGDPAADPAEESAKPERAPRAES